MNENETNPAQGWYPKSGPDAADPAAWYGAMQAFSAETETEEETEAERKHRHIKKVAVSAFALLLAAAMLLSIFQVVDRKKVQLAEDSAAVPAQTLPDAGGESYDDFREYFENYYSGSSDVEIEKTAAETGVELVLSAPAGGELSLQEIYERVSPAVVGITALHEELEYSWGTGVVFTADGYIITNTHILAGCDGARVAFMDGAEYEALLIGADEASDIAVLKIDGEGLPYAEFGVSDTLRVGDEAIAIGNPLGEEYAGTMTNGIISAISRSVSNNGHAMTLLQTNAALNEGNSGGPLVNAYGQVIGITNMKIMGVFTSTVEGIGFAIPSAVVKNVADQLLESGAVRGLPSIGITAGPVSSEAMAMYDLPAGVYVASVSDAHNGGEPGLQVGDILLQVNGEEVATVAQVNEIKDRFGVGDTLTLTIWRDGGTFDLEITLIDAADVR